MGTVDAAIAWLGLQQCVTAVAFVEKHAAVERHGLGLRMTAERTGEHDVYHRHDSLLAFTTPWAQIAQHVSDGWSWYGKYKIDG